MNKLFETLQQTQVQESTTNQPVSLFSLLTNPAILMLVGFVLIIVVYYYRAKISDMFGKSSAKRRTIVLTSDEVTPLRQKITDREAIFIEKLQNLNVQPQLLAKMARQWREIDLDFAIAIAFPQIVVKHQFYAYEAFEYICRFRVKEMERYLGENYSQIEEEAVLMAQGIVKDIEFTRKKIPYSEPEEFSYGNITVTKSQPIEQDFENEYFQQLNERALSIHNSNPTVGLSTSPGSQGVLTTQNPYKPLQQPAQNQNQFQSQPQVQPTPSQQPPAGNENVSENKTPMDPAGQQSSTPPPEPPMGQVQNTPPNNPTSDPMCYFCNKSIHRGKPDQQFHAKCKTEFDKIQKRRAKAT